MSKRTKIFYFTFFIFIVIVCTFLYACNSSNHSHKEILILKSDVSQLTFVENEVNLDEISFEYIDINGNVTVLTANDLSITESDRLSINEPGFKSITFKYNNLENVVCFLVKEKPSTYSYDLNFNANGGSFPTLNSETLSITSNEVLKTPPETPVREGYQFSGWYPNNHFIESEKLVTPYEINPNVTSFVAKWLSAKVHSVSYRKKLDQSSDLNIPKIEDITISDGEKINLIKEIAFRDYDILAINDYLKYDFFGYKISIFDESTGQSNENILSKTHSEPIEISGQTIITLLFKIKKYQVIFSNNNTVISEFEVEHGREVVEGDIPIKPNIVGYETYWYNKTANKNYELNDIKNVTRNIFIELKSKIIKISVNFYDENNIKLTNISQVYNYGDFIGINKVVPLKTGYKGIWRFGDDSFYQPNELEQLKLDIFLYPQIEESKQINFYALYTKKKYILNFHYDLPERTGLVYQKTIDYGDKINAKKTMNSNLFGLRYLIDTEYVYGYDFLLYGNSTWHYTKDISNPSTVVKDTDNFDAQNENFRQNPPWERSEYNFYFNPQKKFNVNNVQFSYPDPNDFDILLQAPSNMIRVEFSNSSVRILDTIGLMENYPRHSISKWAYNATVDASNNLLVYQSFNADYLYYKDDVVLYNSVFYKLTVSESINEIPGTDEKWEVLNNIATMQIIISSDLYRINLSEKHLFNINPVINNSIYPIFEERKFSLQVYDQVFQTIPTATEGKYVYNYEFANVYEKLDFSYEEEISISTLITNYLSSKSYQDATPSNFELLGLFEDAMFESTSYNGLDTINIKNDIKLYAKWIDLNFGSDGLIFSKIDEVATVINFEPLIKSLNKKISLDIIIPNEWQGTPVKIIKKDAFKNLIKYSNIEIKSLTLPEFLFEIEHNELKNIKVKNSIFISGSNTKFNVENNILYELIENNQRNIVKVPTNIFINTSTAFLDVFDIKPYAFAGFENDLILTTSDHASLKSINNFAFIGSSISQFNLGDNITYLGKEAFANCEKLTQVASAVFSQKIEIADNVFKNTPWWISQKTNNKQIIIGNILLECSIKHTDTIIEINDNVSIVSDNAFIFNVQENQQFNEIIIQFSTASNVNWFGNNVFSNTVKKLVVLNENDIILTTSSFNNVVTLEVQQSRIEYFNAQLENLENNVLTISEYTGA